MLVLLAVSLIPFLAAGAYAQAARPFPVVPVTEPPRRSHTWAWVTMAAGGALIGASFPLAHHADQVYDRYKIATDPAEIERLYDETARYDWYARGTLVAGEALIATGLYLRFLRRPRAARPAATLDLEVGPARCALAWRF